MWFLLWAPVDNVAMSAGGQISVNNPLLSILWGICLEVELLDQMIILCLVFSGTAILFSDVTYFFLNLEIAPFYIAILCVSFPP